MKVSDSTIKDILDYGHTVILSNIKLAKDFTFKTSSRGIKIEDVDYNKYIFDTYEAIDLEGFELVVSDEDTVLSVQKR